MTATMENDMRLIFCFVLSVFLATAPAFAEDDHDHDHTPKFGGVVTESGHHHLELVAKDGTVELHIGGVHGIPEMVSKATATASILSKGKKVDVELTPSEGTVLKGSGPFEATKGAIVVLTLRMPDHDPEQVRLKLE